MQASNVYALPPEGVQVYINAADRHPTDTPSYFRIGSSVIADNAAIGHVSASTIVKEIILENLIPTISSGQNYQCYYNVNVTVFISFLKSFVLEKRWG